MRKFLITAFAVMGFTMLRAQGEILELTLRDAIGIALTDNPTIKVADLEIRKQEYVRKESLGNLYPSLNATGSYNRAIIKQDMSRSGLSFGADNTITGTANLTVPLFAPAVYASLQLNRLQMESAVESARSSKIQLVNEVKRTYYGILLAEESLKVLADSENMMREIVTNTQNMYDNGLASEYDLLIAQVQLSNLRPAVIQTENAAGISAMMLKMLLSIPENIRVVVKGNLDDAYNDLTGAALSDVADLSGNSDLRNLSIQSEMLDSQIKLVNSQRMPTIAAFASATITGNDMEDINFLGGGDGFDFSKYPVFATHPDLGVFFSDLFGSGSQSTDTGFWWQNPVSAGVQVSIPIFSGFKNTNKTKQLRTSKIQLNIQKDYLEQSIRMQVRTAANNLVVATETMNVNKLTVNQAERAYNIADVRFQTGSGTMLELNSAQLSLTQAQLNYSQAIYDYLTAKADYEKILGLEYELEN